MITKNDVVAVVLGGPSSEAEISQTVADVSVLIFF